MRRLLASILAACAMGCAQSPGDEPRPPSAAQTIQPPSTPAPASSPAVTPPLPIHVDAVRRAQRSAYAISNATNDCPYIGADLHGWPAASVRHCVYQARDIGLGENRTAAVYLLDVAPDRLARWIETACALVSIRAEQCFDRVLREGRLNSGYQFAVAGNVLEDMEQPGHFKNYIFRNGMTASFSRGVNGSASVLTLEEQERLSALPDSAVLAIPSGLTRFWRTRPADMAMRFPDTGAPANLVSAADRARWLEITRVEMLAALDSDRNRLLEAWLCANAQAMFGDACAPGP